MPIVLKNSKIAGLQKSKCSPLAILAAARLCTIDASASERLRQLMCPPSQRMRPAVLRIFSEKGLFQQSAKGGLKRSRLPLFLPCPASCRAEVSLFKELRVAGNVFGPKLPHHPLYVAGPKAASIGMFVAELT